MTKLDSETKNEVVRYLTYGQLKSQKNWENMETISALNLAMAPAEYDAKLKIYSNNSNKLKGQLLVYKKPRLRGKLPKRWKNSNAPEPTEEELKDRRRKEIYAVRTKIRDYIRNNDFDYFWTLTFDPKVCGKSNDLRFREMGQWLKNERRKAKYRNEDFRYIMIPELHHGNGENSGTIHWHGVTGGYIPTLMDSGHTYRNVKIYNCKSWEYGFSNVQHVRSKAKIANYVMKYMTKDLIESPVRAGKKKYWSSKNLKSPEKYYINNAPDLGNWEPDFETDVCSIYNLSNHDFEELKQKAKSTDE